MPDKVTRTEWVPENLDQLERVAHALEATTAGTLPKWNALDLTMFGFSVRRAVMEMRRARDQGFKPETTMSDANEPTADSLATRLEPNVEPILQFFTFEHLPPHLQEVSRPFAEMARRLVASLPRNPERSVALRKLLESKDAAVRAILFKA